MVWKFHTSQVPKITITGATYFTLRMATVCVVCAVLLFVMAFSAYNRAHGSYLHIDSVSSCLVVHRDKKIKGPLLNEALIFFPDLLNIPAVVAETWTLENFCSSFAPSNYFRSRAPPAVEIPAIIV